MQPGGFRERGDDRWMGWWLVMRGAELFGCCEGQARLMLDRLGEEEEHEGVGWL